MALRFADTDLAIQLLGELGLEADRRALRVIPLDKHLGAVGWRYPIHIVHLILQNTQTYATKFTTALQIQMNSSYSAVVYMLPALSTFTSFFSPLPLDFARMCGTWTLLRQMSHSESERAREARYGRVWSEDTDRPCRDCRPYMAILPKCVGGPRPIHQTEPRAGSFLPVKAGGTRRPQPSRSRGERDGETSRCLAHTARM